MVSIIIISWNFVILIILTSIYFYKKNRLENELFLNFSLLKKLKFIFFPLLLGLSNVILLFLLRGILSVFYEELLYYSLILLFSPVILFIYEKLSFFIHKKEDEKIKTLITPLINELINKEHLESQSINFQINLLSKGKNGTKNIEIIIKVPSKDKEYQNLKENLNKELNQLPINNKYKFNSLLDSPFKKKISVSF